MRCFGFNPIGGSITLCIYSLCIVSLCLYSDHCNVFTAVGALLISSNHLSRVWFPVQEEKKKDYQERNHEIMSPESTSSSVPRYAKYNNHMN